MNILSNANIDFAWPLEKVRFPWQALSKTLKGTWSHLSWIGHISALNNYWKSRWSTITSIRLAPTSLHLKNVWHWRMETSLDLRDEENAHNTDNEPQLMDGWPCTDIITTLQCNSWSDGGSAKNPLLASQLNLWQPAAGFRSPLHTKHEWSAKPFLLVCIFVSHICVCALAGEGGTFWQVWCTQITNGFIHFLP